MEKTEQEETKVLLTLFFMKEFPQITYQDARELAIKTLNDVKEAICRSRN